MDDEVDYMSDAILNKIEDVKPGLFLSRDAKRQRVVEANRRKNKCLSKSETEIHHLKEGLKKKVGPENKGFSLLSKMGYIPGKGLGKNATGIADPVAIEIPQGREGLGFASEKNERITFQENIGQQIQIAYKEEFRSTMAMRFQQNRLNRQLDTARRTCRDLDMKESIKTPVHESFWPPVDPVPTEDIDNAKYGSGSRSSNFKLVKGKLPVRVVLDHEVGVSEDFPDNDLAKLDPNYTKCDYASIQKNFLQLLSYLRSRHNYCFWCSLQYRDQSELLDQCPGENEDQHD
ncbi:hypothetical protein MN116_003783 [Schistosoma mekongi]|uniref:G patch domain-containing protein 11 n=1 Tax=Schistosoma mekongi TaxID=38744 RepID=A0AAE2D744_SCHME|nr:hypothetical protein MN116_003783 [Schistosoma mekongi]